MDLEAELGQLPGRDARAVLLGLLRSGALRPETVRAQVHRLRHAVPVPRDASFPAAVLPSLAGHVSLRPLACTARELAAAYRALRPSLPGPWRSSRSSR